MEESFYVITAYYNPARYRQRLLNYLNFRKYLTVKLLTVELALEDRDFELVEKDADILIQVRSSSVMWHKERLINIGILNLPVDTKYVAWVDCDIVFPHSNWVNEAAQLLKKFPLIQLFDRLVDLHPQEIPEDESFSSRSPSGFSFVYHNHANTPRVSLPKNYEAFRFNACGIAWAAEVTFIKRHLLFDAMILGSGDRMLASAATGKFEAAIATTYLSNVRKEHYMSWAKPFFNDLGGQIWYLPQLVYHLWHGDLKNRGWTERHKELAALGFCPKSNLKKNSMECWEWANASKPLKTYVKKYFEQRLEDG